MVYEGQIQEKKNRKHKLILLQTKDAWLKFKHHTVNVKDAITRSRLNTLIPSISDFHAAIGFEIPSSMLARKYH